MRTFIDKFEESQKEGISPEIRDLLNTPLVQEIGHTPGEYTVKELISELRVRLKSSKKSNIKVTGAEPLLSSLEKMDPENQVLSYAFKSNGKVALVYCTPGEKLKYIGGVIIG